MIKLSSYKKIITSLSELYFRFRRHNLLVQTERAISMNYGSSTSSRKPWTWVRLDLIFISIPAWTHSQNWLAIAEAQSLKLVSTIFYQIFIFLTNDSPSKTMKNDQWTKFHGYTSFPSQDIKQNVLLTSCLDNWWNHKLLGFIFN